ncbi:hypothetical protein JMN32_23690 [Fulvivirga sp. 29W222]|uniref:Uncharacterized protein n=1 Tax=Fulvivirga marina TaxID=2494733 RepID=A0A937G029_9BACT|nr:hypothetical protein [Fulvivirga marina]MBL6449334.1 hypothetical protein [Fulvivirga marina]
MKNHKDTEEVKERIAHFQQRLDKINEGINDQLNKPFFQRNERICRFLDVEKRVNSMVIDQLKWVINEE